MRNFHHHTCLGEAIDLLDVLGAWHEAGRPTVGKAWQDMNDYLDTYRAAEEAEAVELDGEARAENEANTRAAE